MATRSKYGNKKHEVDGITFDSKAEARYYMKLKRNGMSFMPLSETYCAMQENVLLQEGYLCNDRKIAPIYYRADFVIYENGQVKKVIDVKGYQDAISMLKMKMFAHRYGFPVTFAKFDSKINKSNPVEYDTEDEGLKNYLAEYYDSEFQVVLQELVEGSSQKGFEYVYARTNADDRLCFQVADSLNVFGIYNEYNELQRICRHYATQIEKDGKTKNIRHAEIWTDTEVYFFVAEEQGNYELDKSETPNPRPHVLAIDTETEKMLKRSYGQIPFYRLSNNKKETTDLKPIKALIDDYDLMNCFLSNNLQDFAEAIYVVSGFQGDDLSKLRQNVKAKKVVGTGSDGGLDIKTVTIPTEGRKTKMDIDKENIYKFGMAFDSTQVGDGNITNIVNGIDSNAMPLRDPESTFLQLAKGDNYFQVKATSGIGNVIVQLDFQPLVGGV